jgi:MFS family permease
VPYLSFASNFIWVMVIGLLGPSVPAIIMDLDISYTKAGLIFTLLSLGSLIGTPLGGYASDYLNRKILYCSIVFVLSVGLILVGLSPTYAVILLFIFFLSLAGSPAGTVGQSIMLSMFPHRRERLLALQTFFAALGSFTAPLLVALSYSFGLSWRWPFIETAGMVMILFAAILVVPIPKASMESENINTLSSILRNKKIIVSAVLIFFSMGPDIGFSYWLAEYFKSELSVSMKYASAGVSIFLLGMIAGRLITSRALRHIKSRQIMLIGLALALVSLSAFLIVPSVPVKVLSILLYGLGIAPVFPLLMAKGTAVFPDQPGTVSGFLFGCVSLGGMVFPLVIGAVGSVIGIRYSYILIGLIILLLFITIHFWTVKDR